MNIKTTIIPYTLQFKNPVGTSRGIYREHQVWYVVINSVDDSSRWGVGECAPLPDLSFDAMPSSKYLQILQSCCADLERTGKLDYQTLRKYPSILFGLETALQHYKKQSLVLYDSEFSKGNAGILINGLIWMADYADMLKQIEAKVNQGFSCLKLKIGAIDFAEEIKLLSYIRQFFPEKQLTIRVDANGAFAVKDALVKLHQLAEFDIHSIEQPIQAGQIVNMAKLCEESPIAIALDEELIGCNDLDDKVNLLQNIKPQYIILKPTLHGGIAGCNEWINIAKNQNINWWITSALESNVGLNAIAQWTSTLGNNMPQGLGTGGLYLNNQPIPLAIKGEYLHFCLELLIDKNSQLKDLVHNYL